MMLSIPAGVRIYLALEPCDMRRGFDGTNPAGILEAHRFPLGVLQDLRLATDAAPSLPPEQRNRKAQGLNAHAMPHRAPGWSAGRLDSARQP